MPRTARRASVSGIYHVMLRGINKQKIFHDEEDYNRFLYELRKYQEVCGYELYAWCLMPNHIHILIREGVEPLGQVFRRIGAGFVYWYNIKYSRVGHLFQDRFRSEPVEQDPYLLTVIRYIHLNPVKAKLCSAPEEYKYSSYSSYLSGNSMLSAETVLAQMDISTFVRYHHEQNNDECLDISDIVIQRLTDEQLRRLMKQKHGIQSFDQIPSLDPVKQETVLRFMLQSGGSIRQVSRLTGLSIGIVRKYT